MPNKGICFGRLFTPDVLPQEITRSLTYPLCYVILYINVQDK